MILSIWRSLAVHLRVSAAHWRPDGHGVYHGPQAWPWWHLLSLSLLRLEVAKPSMGLRLWIYTRWGALYGEVIVDRRRLDGWNYAPATLCLAILIGATVLLAGCAPAVKPVPVPQVVRVQVPVYVPIPAELTQDCPIAEATSLKVEEAVRVANARKVALQNCNADKAAIRALAVPSDQ